MSGTIKVTFSDACTDVLVWLASLDKHQWRYIEQIAEAAAPADADEPQRSTSYALYTLHEAGLVTWQKIDSSVTWQITDEGRTAVREALTGGSTPNPTDATGSNAPSSPRSSTGE